MLTATTTAKRFSGVRRPRSSVLVTPIGRAIVLSTCLLSVRFCAAKPANTSIRCSCARVGPRGSRAMMLLSVPGISRRPIRFSGAPRVPRLPPESSASIACAAACSIWPEKARSACARSELIVDCTSDCSSALPS